MATAGKNLSAFDPSTLTNCADFRIGIVVSAWNGHITQRLLEGALAALDAIGHRPELRQVLNVPGAFELPLAAELAIDKGAQVVIALGVVIRGETPHFDYVCQGVTQGVIDVQLKFSKPIGYGVLMCENLDQAIARSGRPGSKEDKGFDSAIAALSLLNI